MNMDYSDKDERYFAAPRGEMLKFIPPTVRRMLEIGCGDGRFGESVKARHPVEITGIELDEDAASRARTRLDAVHVADLEVTPPDLPLSYYDCLVFNDVLEHFRDPWQVIRRLRRHLAPGAVLVASIPNLRFFGVMKDLLFRGDFIYRDDGVLDRTHLRFFTKRTMCSLLEDTGFDVKSIEGINQSVRGWKFDLLDTVLGGRFQDMKFVQFAVVGRIRDVPTDHAL